MRMSKKREKESQMALHCVLTTHDAVTHNKRYIVHVSLSLCPISDLETVSISTTSWLEQHTIYMTNTND